MKYALLYGTVAGAIAIALVIATMQIGNHHSLWLGYAAMLVGLSLLYVGVKRARDREAGGTIGFGRALGLGLASAAIAGIVYALGWEIYLAVSGTDFMADYSASMIDEMRSRGASASEIAARSAEMHEFADMYRNPAIRMAMTFIEIFPVGIVVALASAALLSRRREAFDPR
jgi:hypothetical protein